MSDLIRREDAIEALVNLTCFGIEEIKAQCDKSVADSEGWLGGIRDAVTELESLPSAEPERKKGKWLPHPGDEDLDVCSVCGTGCKRRERGISQYIPWVTEYNYQFCPNCGADMRGNDGKA